MLIGLVMVGLFSGLGCDMTGDTIQKPGSGGSAGGGEGTGNPGGENVLFACDQKTCFSGTQYCLRVLNSSQAPSAECANFPSDACRDRLCLVRTLRANNSACHDLVDFEQSQSRITLTCRIAR